MLAQHTRAAQARTPYGQNPYGPTSFKVAGLQALATEAADNKEKQLLYSARLALIIPYKERAYILFLIRSEHSIFNL